MLAGSIALVLAVVAGLAHADGLFLPVTAQDALTVPPANSAARAGLLNPGTTWERRVRIAGQHLSMAHEQARNGGRGRLLLNMRPGLELEVVVERTASTRWGYSLSGHVERGSTGFVTLVVYGDLVAGSIWTPAAEYEVFPAAGATHLLREVNPQPIRCAGAEVPQLTANTANQSTGRADDGTVVDILVVYTPKAEEDAGGEDAVKLSIARNIAYTNDALERSGAFVALNLVGAERVEYVWNSDTPLSRLVDPADGHLDDVHELRDALGADLVNLKPGIHVGGVARQGGAFSIATTPFSFAHEIGHNLGLAHEPLEDQSTGTGPDSILGPEFRDRSPHTLSFGFGYTAEGGSTCSSTIMSYGLACRFFSPTSTWWVRTWVPFYSSPARYHPSDGVPLGASRFDRRQASDAVLLLNRHSRTVANLRPSRKED